MPSAAAFDAAFSNRAPHLTMRGETPQDLAFLDCLFLRCSPLNAALPASILAQQAGIQRASHHAQYPAAMRRIIERETQPIAYVSIDWSVAGLCHGVDIAVLPAHRAGAAGLHLLRAWLDVADLESRRCSLTVANDNPAARLYRRLGFAAAGPADAPFISMIRPVRAPVKAQ